MAAHQSTRGHLVRYGEAAQVCLFHRVHIDGKSLLATCFGQEFDRSKRLRRLLRDMEHEGERVSLNQLILIRAGKGWHGIKLGQPDHSHSIAFTAEIRRMGLTFSPDCEFVLGTARLRTAKTSR
jgi:hypothetical protein